MKTYKITISGDVHGVGFRDFIQRSAEQRGITGEVKNTKEGVELILQGEEKECDAIMNLCKQGPLGAKVDTVQREEINTTLKYTEFRITH